MKRILIVYYSLGGNTKAAAKAVTKGCEESGAQIVLREGLKATEKDLLDCDGLVVGTPDYFSYMAGGLKDFFDRTFYPTQGQVTDKPYVAFVTHGGGGKAITSVESTCASFKFKKVAEPVTVKGKPDAQASAELMELGKKLVQSLGR